MKEIRFGLIGCGVIATRHAQEIQAIEGARLIAVADPNIDKGRTFAQKHGVDWCADYRDLLKRDDIDVVNILTPSGMHGDMTIEASLYKKHIIVEKPMDITLSKANEMIQACRNANVKLSVISQHRFDPSTVRVKKEIEQGSLGKLVLGQAAVNWFRSQAYYESGEWRGTWSLDGGGALMNQGIHTVDLLQYLMGPVEMVFAQTDTLAHQNIEVEDVAVATLRFRNGALGSLVGTTSAYPGFTARIEVFGTGGSAIIDNDLLTHLYIKPENEQGSMYGKGPAENLALAGLAKGGVGTGASDPAAIDGLSHRLQIKDMIEAIQEGREPLVNGEEGLEPLKVLLAIYESARKKEPVFL